MLNTYVLKDLFQLNLKSLSDNPQKTFFVILNEVKNLINTIGYRYEILRLTPQNDVVGQALNVKHYESTGQTSGLPVFELTQITLKGGEI